MRKLCNKPEFLPLVAALLAGAILFAATCSPAYGEDDDHDRDKPATCVVCPLQTPCPPVRACPPAAPAICPAPKPPVYAVCRARGDGSMRCHSRTRLLPLSPLD